MVLVWYSMIWSGMVWYGSGLVWYMVLVRDNAPPRDSGNQLQLRQHFLTLFRRHFPKLPPHFFADSSSHFFADTSSTIFAYSSPHFCLLILPHTFFRQHFLILATFPFSHFFQPLFSFLCRLPISRTLQELPSQKLKSDNFFSV